MNTKEVLLEILDVLESHNNLIHDLQNHTNALQSQIEDQADRIRELQNRVKFLEIKGGGKPPGSGPYGPVEPLSRDPYVYKCENMC